MRMIHTTGQPVKPRVAVEFFVETCYKCGVLFAMTCEHQELLKRDKTVFYCPNGHGQSYCRSTEQELREKVEQLERQRAWNTSYTDQLAQANENLSHKLRAQKGQVTKLKKRISNGVCPCCNRHFANIEQHMKSQHPDFNNEPDGS